MRVALYARVSTEEQSLHGLSIEAQLAALHEAYPDGVEYIDPGISARKPISKRPDLQRLLRDIEQGKFDLVVFTKLDRWTRNIREYYKAQDVLDAHGVAWKALHEDYETQTAAGRLKVNIMLAVAQDEADRTSERVKVVFEEKRKKGLAVNGHVPPGLDYNEGNLQPNADAPRIVDIFSHYIATRSLHSTAIACQDFLGRSYSQRGVKQLLQNDKYLTSGIIEPGVFQTAKSILQQRGTRTVRTDRVYLFSGLVFCPECGCRLSVHRRIWNGVDYTYYRCDRSAKGYRCGWRKGIREETLEAYLLKRILPTVEQYNVTIQRKAKKPVDVKAIQRKLDKLTDLYIEDKLDKETYDKKSEPFRDALKRAQTAPKPVDTQELMRMVDVYPSLSKTAQKSFWSNLVKSITPNGSDFSIEFLL